MNLNKNPQSNYNIIIQYEEDKFARFYLLASLHFHYIPRLDIWVGFELRLSSKIFIKI